MTDQRLSTPRWIANLDEAPETLRQEVAAHDGFFGPAFYANLCSPSGAELDEFRQRPGFKTVDHYRGFVEYDGCIGREEFATSPCATQDLRYLMVGLIGGPNILPISGGVVKPTMFGIDLPMPSGKYLVRVEYDAGSEMFRVARIYRVPDRTVARLRGYTDDELGEIWANAVAETGQDVEFMSMVSDEMRRREGGTDLVGDELMEEIEEGFVETEVGDLGDMVYRASCYVNWDETEWTDATIR